MSVSSELSSGKFTIYAQWCAILSIIFLVVFGILNFLSVIPFAILGFVEAFLMVFLELPLVAFCCPSFEIVNKFKQFFENIILRTVLYLGFAFLIWLSLIMSVSTLIIPAVFLTLTSAFYGIAQLKHEGLERSQFTGGSGIGSVGQSLA